MPDMNKKPPLTDAQEDDLKALSTLLSDTFAAFVLAKTYLVMGYNTLRRAQLFMALGSVYDAIKADPTGDEVFDAERELSRIEIGSRVLRSLIDEVEAAQRTKATANPTIKHSLNDNLH